MNQPITRTKYILPRRRTDLLSRVRLLDTLQDLFDEKLIILAAPAGSGKTSLLVDFAYHTDMPVCWYALDPLDREFNRFVAYFIACINHRFPSFGKNSNLALQNLSPTNPDLDQLVTTIVNEAFECIQEHFLVILDDYHFVNDQDEINTFIGRFLQEVDENCHVVVSSRTLLTLPDLPLMVARSQVGGLGFDDLAFNPKEIQKLIGQNYQVSIDDSLAADLARESEGWITGLLLSTQSKWQGMTDRLRVARVSAVGLYDYLAQQVLDQQPAAVRDFLLRTSLLEEFDAELCETVLGKPAYPGGETWQTLMDTVLRNNLFVLPVGEKGLWIRYHHLFRDFLQSRLAQENQAEEHRIIQKLAQVYTEQNEWEKAHALFTRLGDTGGLINLIERAGSTLIKTGRLQALTAWLDSLDPTSLSQHPILLSLRGSAAVMGGEIDRGLVFLNHAEGALRGTGQKLELVRALSRRSQTYQFLGRYPDALADADEAIQMSAGSSELLLVRALALRDRGLTLYRLGRWGEAIECFKESSGIYDTAGSSAEMALVLIDLGLVYQACGAYMQSRFTYERARTALEKIGDLARLATVLNNLGVLYHAQGEHEKAAGYLENALAYARQSGYTHMEALTLASIGDLYRELDAAEAAEKAYQQSGEIALRINSRFLIFYLTLAQVNLHTPGWKVEHAEELLTRACKLAGESRSTYDQACCSLESGRLSLYTGKTVQAREHFKRAAEIFENGSQKIEAAKSRLYLAGLEYSPDATHLARVFELASEWENQQVLIPVAREVKDSLDAGAIPGLGKQVADLLEQAAKFEESLPRLRRRLRKQVPTVPFAPPRMVIHGLGRAQVLMDNKPIDDIGWKSHDARAFFYLLLSRMEGFTKEAAGEILWPESPPAQLKLQFKNAIYRLRHALEQDAILFDGARYQFNHALDYEYDTETFREKILQAQQAVDIHTQISHLKEAVALYKGDFLPGMDDNWIWPERSQLHQAYQNAVLRLSELFLETRDYDSGLAYCQQLLSRDPCLEEAHRMVMRIQAAMGRKAEIVRQFDRCRQNLASELNIQPSPQTMDLFESLTR